MRNDRNELVTTEGELAKIWKEYTSKLFDDRKPKQPSYMLSTENLLGPPILCNEVWYAIKVEKLLKATGPDGINIEAIKILDDENKLLSKYSFSTMRTSNY